MDTMEKPKFKMMPGSDTGNSYLLIGRKGNIAVGIKPETFKSGGEFGSVGNTWFGAKLRVAPGGALLNNTEQTVVSLKDKMTFDKPADAFPEIKWSKSDHSRGSTVLGILLKGDIAGSKEELIGFLEHLEPGKLSAKVADYMIKLLGGENLLIDRADIIEWFDSKFVPVGKQMRAKIAVQETFVAELEGGIGHFGIHADVLKKAYEKAKASQKTYGPGSAYEDDDADDDGGFED